MKILYFIGSLHAGGKERRLVELISYLKGRENYEMMVVTAFEGIAYPRFQELNVKYICLHKIPKSMSLKIYAKLWRLCRDFKPDIIHTWGRMQTFYMLPVARFNGIPLINSQITDANVPTGEWKSRLMNYFNFQFSSVVLANSYAGLRAYGMEVSNKSRVIYNGLNLNRFVDLSDVSGIKSKYGIRTTYTVIMVASYSANKDYRRFSRVAEYVTGKRTDITFIGVGAISDTSLYEELKTFATENDRIIFYGQTDEVENLVNACDIGVLFSAHGEGISNSILEYMALGKAVIVDVSGGTPEFVEEGQNGFFTLGKSIQEIGDLIIHLIEHPEERERVGTNARETIRSKFVLDRMGFEFERLYREVMSKKRKR